MTDHNWKFNKKASREIIRASWALRKATKYVDKLGEGGLYPILSQAHIDFEKERHKLEKALAPLYKESSKKWKKKYSLPIYPSINY